MTDYDRLRADRDTWKMKAEQAEFGWSQCSRACAKVQDERDAAIRALSDVTNERDAARVARDAWNDKFQRQCDETDKMLNRAFRAERALAKMTVAALAPEPWCGCKGPWCEGRDRDAKVKCLGYQIDSDGLPDSRHETWHPARCCPVSVTCEREQSCSGMCPVRCRPGSRHQSCNDNFRAWWEGQGRTFDSSVECRAAGEAWMASEYAARSRHQVCNDDAEPLVVHRPCAAHVGRPFTMTITASARTAVERCMICHPPSQSVAGKKSPARVNCGKCDHPMGCESECRIKAASDSQSAIGKKP